MRTDSKRSKWAGAAAALALMLSGGTGWAAEAPAAQVNGAGPLVPREKKHTQLGLMLDVGVPSGAGLSVVYRPWKMLRFNAGAITNTGTVGIAGGATFVPFYFPISPSLTLEGGYMFKSSLTWLERYGVESDFTQTQVKYGFANAHAGIELGSARRFLFYIHGGLSYLKATMSNFQGALDAATDQSISVPKPVHVRATFPSAKLGFVVFFM